MAILIVLIGNFRQEQDIYAGYTTPRWLFGVYKCMTLDDLNCCLTLNSG